MSMRALRVGLASLAVAALSFLAVPAMAETVALKAALAGANSVPPVDGKGAGDAVFAFDAATKTLSWTVTFSGLSGDATAAHLHGPADAATNAAVVVPFTVSPSPIKGMATLTDTQAADLLAGKWYVNIHTAAHKDGEIRGQVTAAK